MRDRRADLYARLMAAEDQIAHVLYEHGVSHEEVAAALDAVDDELPDDERRENLYLGALSRFVGALGGQLEVRAVFGDRQVFVHRAPID